MKWRLFSLHALIVKHCTLQVGWLSWLREDSSLFLPLELGKFKEWLTGDDQFGPIHVHRDVNYK